ncbi:MULTISPECIES: Arc family DNA-binding protein [Acinetobacter]|uniref:Arc family DNA-binding protein n=1 Tax=Acinetobacter TaxID=469 RepID=UPI00257C9D67|nr:MULTISPECIES: Arc family DNA-binding protein [Acinetobacter]
MSSGHLNAQYNLRLPDELKQKIAESAKELNRSMNADIVARLEESFEQKFGDVESVPTEELMKELAKRLDGFSVVANK